MDSLPKITRYGCLLAVPQFRIYKMPVSSAPLTNEVFQTVFDRYYQGENFKKPFVQMVVKNFTGQRKNFILAFKEQVYQTATFFSRPVIRSTVGGAF